MRNVARRTTPAVVPVPAQFQAPPVQRLVLPSPPSANRYWRHDRGVTHLAPEAHNYRAEVHVICRRTGLVKLEGPVVLRITWYAKTAAGDLENRTKQLFDAIEGHAFSNDKQVVEYRIRRRKDKERPRVELLIARDGTPEARQILSVEMGAAR